MQCTIVGNPVMSLDKIKAVLGGLAPPPLALADAEAIVEIAQIVVDLDGTNAPDEIATFFGIGKYLFELVGMPELPIPTFAGTDDDEGRMFELATSLKAPPQRELAFAVARALAASDLDVDLAEDEFLDRLRGVLNVDKARAKAIADQLSDAMK